MNKVMTCFFLPVHILHFRSKRWVLCSDVVSLSMQVRMSGAEDPKLGWLVLVFTAAAEKLFLVSSEAWGGHAELSGLLLGRGRSGLGFKLGRSTFTASGFCSEPVDLVNGSLTWTQAAAAEDNPRWHQFCFTRLRQMYLSFIFITSGVSLGLGSGAVVACMSFWLILTSLKGPISPCTTRYSKP